MLNPYHLKYFSDACSNGSLVKAAGINRVSHSAVSQAIRSLELALDTKLLFHGKRRFELTHEGRLLFLHSKEIFENFDRVFSLIQSANKKLSGPLRIGLSHSIAVGLLNDLIYRFCETNPLVEPNIFIGNAATLEQLLESRNIEIGFGVEDGRFVKFERRLIRRGHFVLGRSKNCKDKTRFLVGDKGPEVLAIRAEFKKKKDSPQFIEIQSWSICADLAERGLGTALLPDFIVKSRKHLTQVQTAFKLPRYELCAIFRALDTLSPVSRKFLSQFSQSR
jgi:DNA-binding transcriptional LysR family regulator